MPSTGYKTAGTGANVAGVNVDWSDPTNVQTDNDSAATVAFSGAGSSDNLRVTNFDFARLDAGESIVGIEVQIHIGLSVGVDSDAALVVVQLTLAGSLTGDDQISGTDSLTAAFTRRVYGSSTDLWGATPSITNAQTNTFGIEIRAAQVANTPTVAIRHVRMAIHVTNRKASWTSLTRAPNRGRSALSGRS